MLHKVSLRSISYDKHQDINQWCTDRFGRGCYMERDTESEAALATSQFNFDWAVYIDQDGYEEYYFKTREHATEFKLAWLE